MSTSPQDVANQTLTTKIALNSLTKITALTKEKFTLVSGILAIISSSVDDSAKIAATDKARTDLVTALQTKTISLNGFLARIKGLNDTIEKFKDDLENLI